MKKFSLFDQCTLLRYDLYRNRTDEWGHKFAYKVSPSAGAGGGFIQYFNTAEEVQAWIDQVREMREMQSDGFSLLSYLENA